MMMMILIIGAVFIIMHVVIIVNEPLPLRQTSADSTDESRAVPWSLNTAIFHTQHRHLWFNNTLLLCTCVCQNAGADSNMVDGQDKHGGMDGQKRAAGKKGKKDDLDNLKKEVEMVRQKVIPAKPVSNTLCLTAFSLP